MWLVPVTVQDGGGVQIVMHDAVVYRGGGGLGDVGQLHAVVLHDGGQAVAVLLGRRRR